MQVDEEESEDQDEVEEFDAQTTSGATSRAGSVPPATPSRPTSANCACAQCGGPVASTDRFCRHCASPVGGQHSVPQFSAAVPAFPMHMTSAPGLERPAVTSAANSFESAASGGAEHFDISSSSPLPDRLFAAMPSPSGLPTTLGPVQGDTGLAAASALAHILSSTAAAGDPVTPRTLTQQALSAHQSQLGDSGVPADSPPVTHGYLCSVGHPVLRAGGVSGVGCTRDWPVCLWWTRVAFAECTASFVVCPCTDTFGAVRSGAACL